MAKLWVVYKHTDPEGKVYIGRTSASNPEYRWTNGMKYQQQPWFFRGIVKYGWINFKHEILASGLEYKEACETELKYIKEYKSNDRRYGYNVSPYGECAAPRKKYKMNEEKKLELSLRRSDIMKEKWANQEFRDKTVEALKKSAKRPEYRRRVSESLKATLKDEGLRRQRSDAMKKRMMDEDYKRMCIHTLSKANEKIKKKVMCEETGICYPSIADASRETGIPVYSISRSVNGKTKNTKFHWKYIEEISA